MNIANWRTSVFGIVAIASAYISANPDSLNVILDPYIAKKVAGWAFLISGILAAVNAKDKQVSGNGTVDAPAKVAQSDGTSKIVAPAIVAFLAIGLIGCAAVADFLESPTNAKVISIASSVGGASLTHSLGSKVTPDQEAILQSAATAAIETTSTGAIWWFAEWLRSKQSTPSAAKAGVIAAGGVPLPVASAVPALVATGVPPDAANEAVAMTVQTVASKKP